MDHVKDAINFAALGQAVDFKSSILAALQDKVQDALHLKKMEIGSNLLNDKDDEVSSDEDTIDNNQSDEENVDENL